MEMMNMPLSAPFLIELKDRKGALKLSFLTGVGLQTVNVYNEESYPFYWFPLMRSA